MEILKYIENIELNLAAIKEALKTINVVSDGPEIHPDRLKHIRALMSIDCWPEAMDVSDIAEESVEQQQDRARIILDTVLDESLEGKNFLDFGCGDGWMVHDACRRGANAVGYDIKASSNWNELFTNDIDSLRPNSFDVVFMYDVLDHCVNIDDPTIVMERVKKLLKKNGVVYIRCHPWVSKHATHLCKQGLNKAYIHLFLRWDEFEYLGYKPMATRMETDPLKAYHWWFRNFKIVEERIHKEPVSDFFFVPSFKQLVIEEQKLDGDRRDAFFSDMQYQFIDFRLINK